MYTFSSSRPGSFFSAWIAGRKTAMRVSCGMLFAVLALGACNVPAVDSPAADGAADSSSNAAIASAHPLATQAGHEVLGLGGNAFDAAVAVSAALGVVEPYSSGLGGGGFYLLHRAEDSRDIFVDARETAPAAATPTMYLDDTGHPIGKASVTGPLAGGIPGLPAGLVHLAENYGKLPLAVSLEPAIRYAREGFPVYRRFMAGLRFRRDDFSRWPAFGEVFYPDGEVPADGYVLRQPDLAQTLERLATAGHAGFYSGETARLLVDGVTDAGGIWTLEDFAEYQVVERAPLVATYGDARIVTAPPPSAGGVAIINMLNVIGGYSHLELSAADRRHIQVEAMRRAFRDRGDYVGDPDFVDVPVDLLTDPLYAAGQRNSIRLDRATPSTSLPGTLPDGGEGDNTSHFSVSDSQGNLVAGTQSINTWYGSAFMSPGTGVIVNNEMDDFSIKPGASNSYGLTGNDINAIGPGRRMVSSMTPTIVRSPRGTAVIGTPGGSRIVSMVFLATLAWLDGAEPDAIVSMPRFHHQHFPDQILYETDALTPDEIAGLEARGHSLREVRRGYGNMQIVVIDGETGAATAASDPRGKVVGRVY